MNNFIYVFDEHSKKVLLKKGYKLINKINNCSTNSDITHTYIFENNDMESIEMFDNLKYIKTNTLMF